jgi:hypothetical protein
VTQAGRIGVWSDDPAGGDLFWLDQHGIVSALRYSKSYPGGARDATWQMILDPAFTHRAVSPGRQVGLSCGAAQAIWTGALDNPVRGDVWQFTAIGQAADAKRYLAYAPVSGNALNLAEVLANANGRGLGWTVSGPLPTLTAGKVTSGTIYIDAALDQVSAGQTVPPYWYLDRNAVLTFAPAPTTPGYLLIATNVGGGRTLDAFATDAYVTYESATNVLSTVLRSSGSRPFGRFEVPVDDTGLGLIALSQASAAGDGYLARNGARAKFRDAFTVTAGQLMTALGSPIDLALAEPGVLMSVIVTDPDSAGDVTAAGPTTILIGTTDYDVDSGVLTLTPTEVAQDSLTALLAS